MLSAPVNAVGGKQTIQLASYMPASALQLSDDLPSATATTPNIHAHSDILPPVTIDHI